MNKDIYIHTYTFLLFILCVSTLTSRNCGRVEYVPRLSFTTKPKLKSRSRIKTKLSHHKPEHHNKHRTNRTRVSLPCCFIPMFSSISLATSSSSFSLSVWSFFCWRCCMDMLEEEVACATCEPERCKNRTEPNRTKGPWSAQITKYAVQDLWILLRLFFL